MSTTLTGLVPTIYEALDQVAREQVGLLPFAAKDVSSDMVSVGQTVRSHVAPAATAADITPGVTPPNTGDQTIDYVDMTVSKSRAVSIKWTGEQQLSVGSRAGQILRDQVAQAIRTLVNEMEADLANEAKAGASRAVGTAGTTPFATAGDLSDFAAAARVLDDNGAPQGRVLVVSSAAMQNLRGKQNMLTKVNEAGDSTFLRTGLFGLPVQGFTMGHSAQLRAHTKGTGSGYLVNNVANILVNGTTIATDTGTGTILAGDVVTFAADANNKYVVGSTLAAGSFALNKPGVRVQIPDNNAITVGNDYTPSFAFVPSALQLLARLPAMPAGGDAATDVTVVTDPISGISFQIALYKMYRQMKIEIGAAWGVKAVKSDFIATLLG